MSDATITCVLSMRAILNGPNDVDESRIISNSRWSRRTGWLCAGLVSVTALYCLSTPRPHLTVDAAELNRNVGADSVGRASVNELSRNNRSDQPLEIQIRPSHHQTSNVRADQRVEPVGIWGTGAASGKKTSNLFRRTKSTPTPQDPFSDDSTPEPNDSNNGESAPSVASEREDEPDFDANDRPGNKPERTNVASWTKKRESLPASPSPRSVLYTNNKAPVKPSVAGPLATRQRLLKQLEQSEQDQPQSRPTKPAATVRKATPHDPSSGQPPVIRARGDYVYELLNASTSRRTPAAPNPEISKPLEPVAKVELTSNSIISLKPDAERESRLETRAASRPETQPETNVEADTEADVDPAGGREAERHAETKPRNSVSTQELRDLFEEPVEESEEPQTKLLAQSIDAEQSPVGEHVPEVIEERKVPPKAAKPGRAKLDDPAPSQLKSHDSRRIARDDAPLHAAVRSAQQSSDLPLEALKMRARKAKEEGRIASARQLEFTASSLEQKQTEAIGESDDKVTLEPRIVGRSRVSDGPSLEAVTPTLISTRPLLPIPQALANRPIALPAPEGWSAARSSPARIATPAAPVSDWNTLQGQSAKTGTFTEPRRIESTRSASRPIVLTAIEEDADDAAASGNVQVLAGSQEYPNNVHDAHFARSTAATEPARIDEPGIDPYLQREMVNAAGKPSWLISAIAVLCTAIVTMLATSLWTRRGDR